MVFLKKIHRQYEIFFSLREEEEEEGSSFSFLSPMEFDYTFFLSNGGFFKPWTFIQSRTYHFMAGRRIYEMGKYLSTPYATLGLRHPKHFSKVKEAML